MKPINDDVSAALSAWNPTAKPPLPVTAGSTGKGCGGEVASTEAIAEPVAARSARIGKNRMTVPWHVPSHEKIRADSPKDEYY